MRLCDELEAVRSAWKQEGAQLRARIVRAASHSPGTANALTVVLTVSLDTPCVANVQRQLHDARLAAEARAADAEARLKSQAAGARDERGKLEARALQAEMLAEQRDVYRRQTEQQHEKEVEQLMMHAQELSRQVTDAQVRAAALVSGNSRVAVLAV